MIYTVPAGCFRVETDTALFIIIPTDAILDEVCLIIAPLLFGEIAQLRLHGGIQIVLHVLFHVRTPVWYPRSTYATYVYQRTYWYTMQCCGFSK